MCFDILDTLSQSEKYSFMTLIKPSDINSGCPLLTPAMATISVAICQLAAEFAAAVSAQMCEDPCLPLRPKSPAPYFLFLLNSIEPALFVLEVRENVYLL